MTTSTGHHQFLIKLLLSTLQPRPLMLLVIGYWFLIEDIFQEACEMKINLHASLFEIDCPCPGMSGRRQCWWSSSSKLSECWVLCVWMCNGYFRHKCSHLTLFSVFNRQLVSFFADSNLGHAHAFSILVLIFCCCWLNIYNHFRFWIQTLSQSINLIIFLSFIRFPMISFTNNQDWLLLVITSFALH